MFAVVYIPNFSLQAALRLEPASDEQCVALSDSEGSEPLIVQVNQRARQLGVVAGLTGSQALARCGHLLIRSRSPAQEKSAAEILLQVAYAFSANIEETSLGVCTLELKGLQLPDATARQMWGAQILKTLATFHLEARLGFGPTPELALMAAQVAEPILIVQDPAEFIATLPMTVLEPSREILEILRLWGIGTVGAFIALGKDKVIERLGEGALELFDRVSPHSLRPLKLVVPAEHFTEQIEFEKGVETLEPLLGVLRQFIEQLTGRLTLIHLVAGELRLELGLESGEKNQFAFKVPAPTNDIEVLFRTLRTHLETLKTNSPVRFFSLTIQPAKLQGHQFGIFEATLRNPNRFFGTVALLGALCGAERVGAPVLEPTHKPDSFRMQPPNFDATGQSAESEFQPAPALRRFRPVVPATIKFGDQGPVSIRSQVYTGAIAKTAGPYASSGHWWEGNGWRREEWDAQAVNGAWYRIFRSLDGDFVEGVYD
jgi:protein ImuB